MPRAYTSILSAHGVKRIALWPVASGTVLHAKLFRASTEGCVSTSLR